MSTLAIEGSDADARRGPGLALRYADLALLALALPVFLLAGLPMLGYAAITLAWLAQHAVLWAAERGAARALAAGDRRRALGLISGSVLARLWLVATTILLVGLLAEREDGLAAAVLAFVLVTFHLGSLAATKLLYPQKRP